MNRRTAVLVALAAVAVVAVIVVGVVNPFGTTDGEGTPDAAETPRFVHEGDRLTLEPAPEQTIHGVTDLENGTALTVRLRSSGEDPFLRSDAATVDGSGAFEASFDVSGVAEGTTFDVVVTHDTNRILETTGEVAG